MNIPSFSQCHGYKLRILSPGRFVNLSLNFLIRSRPNFIFSTKGHLSSTFSHLQFLFVKEKGVELGKNYSF